MKNKQNSSGHLDSGLLKKLSDKTGRSILSIRKLVSSRAIRNGITLEAALVLWARSEKIGTRVYTRSLPHQAQVEIRDRLGTTVSKSHDLVRPTATAKRHRQIKPQQSHNYRIAWFIFCLICVAGFTVYNWSWLEQAKSNSFVIVGLYLMATIFGPMIGQILGNYFSRFFIR